MKPRPGLSAALPVVWTTGAVHGAPVTVEEAGVWGWASSGAWGEVYATQPAPGAELQPPHEVLGEMARRVNGVLLALRHEREARSDASGEPPIGLSFFVGEVPDVDAAARPRWRALADRADTLLADAGVLEMAQRLAEFDERTPPLLVPRAAGGAPKTSGDDLAVAAEWLEWRTVRGLDAGDGAAAAEALRAGLALARHQSSSHDLASAHLGLSFARRVGERVTRERLERLDADAVRALRDAARSQRGRRSLESRVRANHAARLAGLERLAAALRVGARGTRDMLALEPDQVLGLPSGSLLRWLRRDELAANEARPPEQQQPEDEILYRPLSADEIDRARALLERTRDASLWVAGDLRDAMAASLRPAVEPSGDPAGDGFVAAGVRADLAPARFLAADRVSTDLLVLRLRLALHRAKAGEYPSSLDALAGDPVPTHPTAPDGYRYEPSDDGSGYTLRAARVRSRR